MRLLPGYATAAVSARAVAVRRHLVRDPDVQDAQIVEAVAFEILPVPSLTAPSATDTLPNRTAIQQYSRINRINQQSTGRLDIYL